MDAKDFLNWAKLSRTLSGTSRVVLKNKYPKKHEPFIKELIEAVETVLKKYGMMP
jgi:hypothetical protein